MTFLIHEGTKKHSGRYPWGSGDNPHQRNKSFLDRVQELKKQGLSDQEIAAGFGMKSQEFRNRKTIALASKKEEEYNTIDKYVAKGWSNMAISRETGMSEATIRNRRNMQIREKDQIIKTTANMIRSRVDQYEYVDVGKGVELDLGVNETQFKTALTYLEDEGYKLHYVDIPQLGTDKKTSMRVLGIPGSPYPTKAIRPKIKLMTDYSEDGGRSFMGLEPIRSVSSKKVAIRYAEDGGTEKDGLIELRRNVPELTMSKRYAQVRIGVDGTHYIKGMAMYSDNLPDGVDILFNTNKSKTIPMIGEPKNEVLKRNEPPGGPFGDDNPFGSMVRQKHYIDDQGNKQLSALNIVGYKVQSEEADGVLTGEEGAWGEWAKAISSQMLSKQTTALAKKQLGLAYDSRKKEFDEIMALTNPVVKQKMLESFASDSDSAAVHLKGAALPRQMTHVLLPLPSMKENEIYAPNYNDGEQVVLIRHPHGGIFEIPQLTVNNNNPTGKRLLGDAKDAVGINPKVAQQLSGADFDGDTVLVIPNPPTVGIQTRRPEKELIDFDPKAEYKRDPSLPKVGKETGFHTGPQMGAISNLITDMSVKGAPMPEIIRAVKHSMVVIDAEKHNLDYKKSYEDNRIAALKQYYQGGANRGASTLISKAKSRADINQRSGRTSIDPETGKVTYFETGKGYDEYVNKKGKLVKAGQLKTRTTKMAITDDAFTLSSGTRIENVYATHANELKALANEARKESLRTGTMPYSASANKAYAEEVSHLKAQLLVALKNAPLERHAQLLANSIVDAKKQANPDMEKSDLKKIKNMVLNEQRTRIGAKKEPITISDREWEAIQAGAIRSTTLKDILSNTNMDRVKELATPRASKPTLTPSKLAKAKALLASGHTQAEVASSLGVSVSTLSKAMN